MRLSQPNKHAAEIQQADRDLKCPLNGSILAGGRYHYTVDHIKQEEYKGAEVSYVDGGSGERHIYDRHGIRLVFTVTVTDYLVCRVLLLRLLAAAANTQRGHMCVFVQGNVGHFDLPTLFIQLVTCMVRIEGLRECSLCCVRHKRWWIYLDSLRTVIEELTGV